MAGKLYLVSTPIGNLGDMTVRAVEVLRSVDFVAAEDTRVGMKLLSAFDITKPLVSYYEHNKRERGEIICRRILDGENCALTTDAGTPAISDPGSELVAQCREYEIEVVAVPGACAAIAAYSLSGLTGGRFCFEGFLSMNRRNRREHLEGLKNEKRAMIFYEAPHKLKSTLEDLADTFGVERSLLIARELTKLHEEAVRRTIGEAISYYADTPPRGEFVLVVDGASDAELSEEASVDPLELAKKYVAEGMRVKDAAKKAAEETGTSKNELYRALIDE